MAAEWAIQQVFHNNHSVLLFYLNLFFVLEEVR